MDECGDLLGSSKKTSSFEEVPLVEAARPLSVAAISRTSAQSAPPAHAMTPPRPPRRGPGRLAPLDPPPPLAATSAALLPHHHRRTASDPESLRAVAAAALANGEVSGRHLLAPLGVELSASGGILASSGSEARGAGPSTPGREGNSAAGNVFNQPEGRAGGAGQTPSDNHKPPDTDGAEDTSRCCSVLADPLLMATLIGVVLGIAAGLALRRAALDANGLELLGLPGELMLRALKALVVPLVAGSMVAGVCALQGAGRDMGRVARLTLLYYAGTTMAAVALGVALVNLIRPGRGGGLGGGASGDCGTAAAPAIAAPAGIAHDSGALLGVARAAVPDNVVSAAANMNVLGVITFSLFFGLCLAGLGPQGNPLVRLVEVFNCVVARMVTAVLWTSPVGVASLIAAAICRACSLAGAAAALGAWVATVLLGLALFGGAILPGAFWAATRRAPGPVAARFGRALVLAFGTSSSSAALPAAMECARDVGCADAVVGFVLPLGTTVNMNGTALYEATTVIFLAQAHGVSLGIGGTATVAVVATLAAVGAAAIPSAGLVTMVMVLQAVGLGRLAPDLAAVLAVDWLLDRVRTAVNLLGDALGVVLVDHLAKQHPSAGRLGAQPYSQLEMA